VEELNELLFHYDYDQLRSAALSISSDYHTYLLLLRNRYHTTVIFKHL